MDYKALSSSAETAIDKLGQYTDEYGSTAPLESIRQQLIFIRDHALENKDPVAELEENKPFTYNILASREFASPEELEIKKKINYVTRILCSD